MDDTPQYRRLALACVVQAIKDATRGDAGALEWLRATGVNWLALADVEMEYSRIERATRRTWRELRAELQPNPDRQKESEVTQWQKVTEPDNLNPSRWNRKTRLTC